MCGQEIFKRYSDIFKIVELLNYFRRITDKNLLQMNRFKQKFNIFKFNNFHVHVFLLSLHSNENYPPLKL